MQSYNRSFARVYNTELSGFAVDVAPRIEAYYSRTVGEKCTRSVLDLCCGTGQLALLFAARGYRVVGLDSSIYMLDYARKNNQAFIEAGTARFCQADVAEFELDEQFGLAVSTYDSISHLENEELLIQCFRSTFKALEPHGLFIFDLNTRASLINWNSIQIRETDRILMISRGLFDGVENRALIRLSGFFRDDGTMNDLYERFDQTISNSAFDLNMVRRGLIDVGWSTVHFAEISNLDSPIDDPESVSRENAVFVVAWK